MEIGAGWTELGLPGLFLASFLAATLLPFSSEALLLLLLQGPWSSAALLVVAGTGNTLGGLVNYVLGRWLAQGRTFRWLRADTAKAERWRTLVERYGAWCALLCWLPVIGDPIAVVLGLVGARPVPVAVGMLVGKVARYAVVIAVVRGFC